MRRVAVIIILVLLAGCGAKPDVGGRIAFWEGVVNKELPPGTSKSTIMEWGKKKGIEFTNLGGLLPQNTLTAWVESIPDHSSLVCDEWMIRVEITLDSRQQSTRNKVESVGSCL